MATAERTRGRIYDDITQTIGNTPLIRHRAGKSPLTDS